MFCLVADVHLVCLSFCNYKIKFWRQKITKKKKPRRKNKNLHLKHQELNNKDYGQRCGVVVALLPDSSKGCVQSTLARAFLCGLHKFSLWIFSRVSGFPPQAKDMHDKRIDVWIAKDCRCYFSHQAMPLGMLQFILVGHINWLQSARFTSL